jgi:hypothetical protein
MKSIQLIPQLLCAALWLTFTGGCTTNYQQVSVKQSVSAGGPTVPHRAVVVVNQALTDYRHQFILVGGTEVYPIGDALRAYATNTAAESFQGIDVASSEDAATSFPNDDLILIPRVVKSDTTYSVIGIGHTRFYLTMVVEWTVKSRANGKVVWLKTFTVQSDSDAGTFNIHKQRLLLFQKAFDELGPQTYKAFVEAPELR